MDPISKRLRDHYAATFDRHGPTSQGIDWGPDESRVAMRYDNMLAVIEAGIKDKFTLLDAGCGYGGLLAHAREKAVSIDYAGIDVAQAMIETARSRHPGVRFVVGDVLDLDCRQEQFDYVICSGILTQKLDVTQLEMDAFANRLIRHLFSLATRGVAFNMMTTKVNFFANNLYYRNPAEMLAWAMAEITPRVRIDHSYPMYEYTVYLYKEKR